MNVPCGRPRKLEGIALEQEFPVALVQKEQRTAAAHHQKILDSLVFEIREQRARRAIQHAHSSGLGHIFEGSVAAIAIEPVGKSGRLADIQIVESVVIEISHRQAVVAVNVDPARSIENRAPVVDPAKHLSFVRFSLAESLRGNINENGFAGPADNFSGRFPREHSPSARLIARPPGLPLSNALLAPLVRCVVPTRS